MLRKAASAEFDRINLRITTALKTAIENNLQSEAIPEKTYSDYLDRLAKADLKRLGISVATMNGAAAKPAKKAAAKKPAPKPPAAKAKGKPAKKKAAKAK